MARRVVEIVGLSKRFGAAPYLDQVGLDVMQGEVLGLVGLNGAGKSSLLRCLLNLTEYHSGDVRLFGQPARQASARSGVAYLPERFLPPVTATGETFVRHMFKLYRRPFDSKEFGRVLDGLQLSATVLRKRLGKVSKGEAQELGPATTLASGKQLLVYDEPMSGLDPLARALLREQLMELRRSNPQQAILLSSHLLNDVGTLCDRLAILHCGTMRFVGTPDHCNERFGGHDVEQAFLSCIAA